MFLSSHAMKSSWISIFVTVPVADVKKVVNDPTHTVKTLHEWIKFLDQVLVFLVRALRQRKIFRIPNNGTKQMPSSLILHFNDTRNKRQATYARATTR